MQTSWKKNIPILQTIPAKSTGPKRKEIRKMKEKNLAVKLLERLLKERIHGFERTNVVQNKKFSDLLNMALSNYLKGMLTNEEVIEEVLRMTEEIKQNEEESNKLGLSVEEKAFYDALSSPEGIREAYSGEQFVALTKELTEQLRKNRTIDWNRNESARAKMRVLVKRLLKKYKYPPEGQEKALETVMAQCNKWADEIDRDKKKVVNLYTPLPKCFRHSRIKSLFFCLHFLHQRITYYKLNC